MNKFTRYALSVFIGIFSTFFIANSTFAQDSAVKFTYSYERINNDEVVLKIKGKISPGIKLFALQKSEDEILFSTLKFEASLTDRKKGDPTQAQEVQKETNPELGELRFLTDSLEWQQILNATPTDSFLVKGAISYMYQQGAEFFPQEQSFQLFVLPAGSGTSITKNEASVGEVVEGGTVATRSLTWIFLAGFAGGLIALITPCVFSMIPVTVSFFIKRSQTKAEGIKNAFLYATSIIFIFTLLGFLITVIFGPTALNNLATNWIANFIFFLIFLIFGISFLGAFEITLPSAWSNRADSKAGATSFMGIFFMALTLVLVSFSCTGPIIGNLLVIAARGSYYGPLLGMLGFSIALALPFALFAFFPGSMNMLGKAGGWLNAVKVSLGFLELALALKFLSNADLVKGWRILDREVFIALWIVIFVLWGIYLLGKLKFHHDDELPKNDFGISFISIPRLFFAITAFSFALYMLPGMWGAPLKAVSAFVPPMGTQDFTSAPAIRGGSSAGTGDNELPHPVKYYDRMKMYEPEVVVKYGMTTYFDYDEALAVAKKLDRPLMLDFTGINCVNCRKMEGSVWSDPEVMRRLKDNFVIASLYVDVHRDVDLQPDEQYFSPALGKQITDMGDKNADLQVSVYNANTQPYYFFLDNNEKRLVTEGYGFDQSIKKFIELLDAAVAEYESRK